MFVLPRELEDRMPALLGYINFAEGRPDARVEKTLNDLFAHLSKHEVGKPWELLQAVLEARLTQYAQEASPAFRDIEQAKAVLHLVFGEVLPSYRRFHVDLLHHQTEEMLWQPLFLARVFEAVLAQRGPWQESDRIVSRAIADLNDFVGHRPVATLENTRRGEPYKHERVRPVPLYLRGVGVGWGPYREVIVVALQLLESANPEHAGDANFEFQLMDELALDPRGYDFDSPADKRTNYLFGEWDPHLLDNRGRYRRFVVRQIVLDALLHRIAAHPNREPSELLFESAAVLAGTILMASAVSGSGPTTHDSTVTLGNLIPRIAKLREGFYGHLIQHVPGTHGHRLRDEAATTRQPFGSVRQFLNQYLAQQRALHLQRRHLAILFARLGYPGSARRQLQHIPVASARLQTEIHASLAQGRILIRKGLLDDAIKYLVRSEDLLKRAIGCGALPDPWNILGFQGQYPRFQSMEDSVRDHRIHALVDLADRLFDFYAHLVSEGAARGLTAATPGLRKEMRRLAQWWDRFATTTVSDIPHVQGQEAVRSAEHVAETLAIWHERGSATGDLGFWRHQLENFRTPKAFALVIEALLERSDYEASLALLVTWLSQADQAPLVEGDYSFHDLALRWMLSLIPTQDRSGEKTTGKLVSKFFDYLEANAEDYWQVPILDPLGTNETNGSDEGESGIYGAAYEGMSYQDSTDDGNEGELLDGPGKKDFDLAHEADRLERRLRFLETLARLWVLASRVLRSAPASRSRHAVANWLSQARQNLAELLRLLDQVHAHKIPKPGDSFEDLIEYDRRNNIKDRLLSLLINTCLEHQLAVGATAGLVEGELADEGEPEWGPMLRRLEKGVVERNSDEVRQHLGEFLKIFRQEPLLYTPLNQGGNPRLILRATYAQKILRALSYQLPRLGLVREVYLMLRQARAVEASQPLSGPRITEYDRLYYIALQSVAETVLRSGLREAQSPEAMAQGLETVVEPFLALWMDHSQTLRLSILESLTSPREWKAITEFIQKYGRDVLTPRLLSLANIRGILKKGVAAWLNDWQQNSDPTRSIRLLEELGEGISIPEAEKHLRFLLQVLEENYAHYLDYDKTTSQSDYGDNLHQLLDFLRVKVAYERTAWRLKPLTIVHEVLARLDGPTAAEWRQEVERFTLDAAEQHLAELDKTEKKHGFRLVTIADRLRERFVKPMEIDRLCALIEPTMAEAENQIDRNEPCPLEAEIEPWASVPIGVGLEVPQWIQRLEQEFQRTLDRQSELNSMAENLVSERFRDLAFNDLVSQLREWKILALEDGA